MILAAKGCRLESNPWQLQRTHSLKPCSFLHETQWGIDGTKLASQHKYAQRVVRCSILQNAREWTNKIFRNVIMQHGCSDVCRGDPAHAGADEFKNFRGAQLSSKTPFEAFTFEPKQDMTSFLFMRWQSTASILNSASVHGANATWPPKKKISWWNMYKM